MAEGVRVGFLKLVECQVSCWNKYYPALFIEGKEIEHVTEFKLLDVHISDDFCRESHVNALYNKVSSRLYFLKLLKRSGVAQMIYYTFTLLLSDLYLNMRALYGTTI